MSYKSNAVKL